MFYVGVNNHPQHGKYRYLQTQPDLQRVAKDRSGALAEMEAPNMTSVINKIQESINMAQLNFNATNVEPDAGTPVPVPAGVYNVMVDESDVKPTSNGSGAYLQVRYNILDGKYAGRKLF